MPSRGRVDGLLAAIHSVLNCATGNDFEILVRLDDDDSESVSSKSKIEDVSPLVSVIVGPRWGYDMLDLGYYNQLHDMGRGRWLWCFGDDMLVKGRGWDEQLAKVPLTGYYVEPGVHELGTSKYPNDSRCGSYWIVRNCFKFVGFNKWPAKADYTLTAALDNIGWKPWFLEGITVWHDGRPR